MLSATSEAATDVSVRCSGKEGGCMRLDAGRSTSQKAPSGKNRCLAPILRVLARHMAKACVRSLQMGHCGEAAHDKSL